MVAAALDAETLAERLEHAHRASEVRHLMLGRPVEEIAMAAALGAGDAVERWKREVRDARPGDHRRRPACRGRARGPARRPGLDAAWAALLDEGAGDRERQLAAALGAAQ